MLPRPSKDVTARFIASCLPDYEWLLKHAASEGGWLRFEPRLLQFLERLKISDYAKWYLEGDKLPILMLLGFLGPEGVKELNEELINASPQKVNEFLDGWLTDAEQLDFGDVCLFPDTPQDEEEVRRVFEALSVAEQRDVIRQAQYFYTSAMVGFFDILAVMVHGERMTRLVSRATAGDDEAFVKAVQIDQSVLNSIPYFHERQQRARWEGDSKFLRMLSYRLSNPPVRGKIRHRRLWLVFAILDNMNWLDGGLKDREILDICDAANVDRWENRIEDVNYVTKRRLEFRRFQKIGV